MKIMLEFVESADPHGIWQKVTIDGISTSALQGPDITWPLESKRNTTVELITGATILMSPPPPNLTVRVSVARSRTPF
jgi:hypothetical protein